MFENISADLHCYEGQWGSQGFRVMVVCRYGGWRFTVQPVLLRKLFSLFYRVLYKLIQIVTGVELPCEVRVGRNFVIDHFGAIVISGYACFADDCRLRDGGVVGLRRVSDPLAPTIGNNVNIGAGASFEP